MDADGRQTRKRPFIVVWLVPFCGGQARRFCRGIRMSGKRPRSYRRNALWVAAMVHRISGIGLAVFLPFHFLVLGLSLQGAGKLDGFLRWADLPLVKLAEGGLIFLLAVHFLGGLRVLFVENFDSRGNQLTLATTSGTFPALVSFPFLA